MKPLVLIAAVARNGVIGQGQAIPWRIPSDQQFFKRQTMARPLVMGRKQFETVGRPLPGRTNIVVTRQTRFQAEGIMVTSSIADALALADASPGEDIMGIGGGEIYRLLMPRADRLIISHVDLEPEGNVYFPAIDSAQWRVVDEPAVLPDPRDEATYRVKVYARREGSAH